MNKIYSFMTIFFIMLIGRIVFTVSEIISLIIHMFTLPTDVIQTVNIIDAIMKQNATTNK